MRVLEMFCGTKSVGKVAKRMGHDVTSLDIEERYKPTILVDVLKWDYKKFKPGHFYFIWASPPCTEFSIAKTNGIRDLKTATKIVRRTLKIIEYLKPKYFVIENPVGLLRHQPVMKNYMNLMKTVSYCRYGFLYRKNTDLWTNVSFEPKKCVKGSYCKSMRQYCHHLQSVQQGASFSNGERIKSTHQLCERYSVPKGLITDIFKAT